MHREATAARREDLDSADEWQALQYAYATRRWQEAPARRQGRINLAPK